MFLYDFRFWVYSSFNHSSDNSAMLVYFYGDHQVEGVIGSVIDQIEAFASAGFFQARASKLICILSDSLSHSASEVLELHRELLLNTDVENLHQ